MFIPEYASLTYDINKQKTAKELTWTEAMETQLSLLKDKFQQALIRAPPWFDLPAVFQLTTNYSSWAISAILSQCQDGKDRLFAAVGCMTTDPETWNPSWKREMAATIAGHTGMEATLARITMHFWWPTVQRDVRLMVKTCPECVQKITKPSCTATLPPSTAP